MHSSIFSYNITKPYPFKWFTPLVFIGGTILAILFSILNLVSSGYSLITESSTDPNTTISQGIWFDRWPSFIIDKLQPTCSTVDIPINTQFFTNQTALTYTLISATNTTSNALGSLTYQNNLFQNCTIDRIDIELDQLVPKALDIAIAQWGPTVIASVTCSVSGQDGFVSIGLTIEYANVLSNGFVTPSKNGSVLYWGESLLSMFWVQLSRKAHESIGFHGNPITWKGTMSFEPNGAIKDFTDPEYFARLWWFTSPSVDSPANIDEGYVNTNRSGFTDMWPAADSLAKSLHSVVLTDLGQASSPYPNILTNATLLQYFTSNFSEILKDLGNVQPGPATREYNPLNDAHVPLVTPPSVIPNRYLCQVPKGKSTGSMFIAILVQDLVFLQTSWRLFTFVVGFFLTRNKPHANWCEGCLAKKQSHELGAMDTGPPIEERDTMGHDNDRSDSQQTLIPKRRSFHSSS